MIPTWLSRILEALPGKPYQHVLGLMLMVVAIVVFNHVILTPRWTITLTGMLFIIVMWLDSLMVDQDLIDTRDWVVVRAFTTAFYTSLILWMLSEVVTDVRTGKGVAWYDYFIAPVMLIILFQEYRTFLRVLALARELPGWNVETLVDRSELGEDEGE